MIFNRLSSCIFGFAVSLSLIGCDHNHHDKIFSPTGETELLIADTERKAFSGQNVTLHAFTSEWGDGLNFEWKQISGTKVTWVSNDQTDAVFTAPSVASRELLSFKAVATDSSGSSESTKVAIEVFPEAHLIAKAHNAIRSATSGELVSLHATGQGASSESWEWNQVSPSTPAITLNRSNTADPDFIAPDVASDLSFKFMVTYTDTSTGASVSDTTSVLVHKAEGATSNSPLTLSNSQSAPPQKLSVAAPPDAIVVEGNSTNIAMTVSGGTEPYVYLWEQTSGTSAALAGATTPTVSVTAPSVSSAETITLKLTVTDDNGSGDSLTATARVRVVPTPSTAPTPTPTADIIRPLPSRKAVSGVALTVSTELLNPTFTQTGGSVGTLSSATTSGSTTSVTFTPVSIATNSEQAQITISGNDSDGNNVKQIIPIVVHQPPGTEAVTAPPVVPVVVPQLLDKLVASQCAGEHADENQLNHILGVCASGGTGTYWYEWSSLGTAPAVSDIHISHPTVDVPAVTIQGIAMAYRVNVTDGYQHASALITVLINNIAASVTLDPLSNINAASNHSVTLHQPPASGGVPPYDWTVTQTSGTAVSLMNASGGSNKQFTAPTLTAGSADEILTFEHTITDSFLNTVKTTQDVIVEAPAILAAELHGPSAANQGEIIHLNTNVSGGTPPYQYSYTVSGASLTIGSEANPEVTLPSIAADGAQLDITISLTVTDNNAQSTNAGSITVQVAPPAKPAVSAETAAAEQAVTQQITQMLSQAGGSSEDLTANLATQLAEAAKDLPESELTAAVFSPASVSLLANCGTDTNAAAAGSCNDLYAGNCSTDLTGGQSFTELNPMSACFMVPVCMKSTGACNGVTPEMKQQMDNALQSILDWFDQHPGCHAYLDPSC